MMKVSYKFFILLIFLVCILATANAIAADEEHEADAETHETKGGGGHEEVHYSILHFIKLLLPFIPESKRWGQPDLILNTYFVIILLSLFAIFATRKIKEMPESNIQNFLEWVIDSLNGFFSGVLGEAASKYAPYVSSIFIFILCLNFLGLVPGFQSPTADLNTTLALGITAVLGVQIIGIIENGFIGYIKHLMGEPIWLAWLQFPIHVVGELSRALSLAIRLFGNVFGEETVIVNLLAMAAFLLPIAGEVPWIPAQLPMMFFGLLFGFIQALVFSLLTAIYIVTFTSHHEEEHAEVH